jgi:hypothetical protein
LLRTRQRAPATAEATALNIPRLELFLAPGYQSLKKHSLSRAKASLPMLKSKHRNPACAI